ncbi:MAG: hypothetical protein RL481_1203 [Pseudomonadota bacterium]
MIHRDPLRPPASAQRDLALKFKVHGIFDTGLVAYAGRKVWQKPLAQCEARADEKYGEPCWVRTSDLLIKS